MKLLFSSLALFVITSIIAQTSTLDGHLVNVNKSLVTSGK